MLAAWFPDRMFWEWGAGIAHTIRRLGPEVALETLSKVPRCKEPMITPMLWNIYLKPSMMLDSLLAALQTTHLLT